MTTDAERIERELAALEVDLLQARGRYLGQLRAAADALDLAPLAIALAECERRKAELVATLHAVYGPGEAA